MPAGRFQDNPAYHAELTRIRQSAMRQRQREQQQDIAAETLRLALISEKRCIRCGLHCPKRYDHMKSHLCGDCFLWRALINAVQEKQNHG